MTESTGLEPALVENSVADAPVLSDSAPDVKNADVAPEPPISEGAQKRIDRLTREKRELEWELDRRRSYQPPAPPAAKTEETKKAPTLEEHNYDEAAYQTALVAHVKDEAARQVRDEFRKEQEQLTQKQRNESWRKRESEFAAKTPDYQDKAYYAPITDVMADIIKDSEKGPEIAYYFGDNPDEARAIAGMSERQAAFAIGRIESKLEAPPAPAPAPKPVSKAPPPPPKIDATEPAVAKDISDPDLSDAEFDKIRKRQIAQRRNR